jgi:hypothetical protein
LKELIEVGMPHLVYHGLDPVWLLKYIGHKHWKLIEHVRPINKDNQRLYASFFAAKIDFLNGQQSITEKSTIEVSSEIFKFNNLIYRSSHTVNDICITLDSIFVRKDKVAGLIKDEPAWSITDIPYTKDTFLEEHSELKRKLINVDFATAKELVFNPAVLFNGVKILYCANYLSLVLLSEWITYQSLLDPIKKIEIFWFKNISVGDKVYGTTSNSNNVFETVLISNNRAIGFCRIYR